MIISMIQESCMYLFVINHLVSCFILWLDKTFIFFTTYNSKFSYVDVWFIDQNSQPLKVEDKINITLVIKM